MLVRVFRAQRQFARIGVNLRGTTAVALCLFTTVAPLAAQDLTWALPGDGTWNLTDQNWEDPGAVPSLFTDGSSVTFGGAGALPVVVTLDLTDVATPSINFAADNYTIATTGGFTISPTGGVLAIGLDPGVTAEITAPLGSLAGETITVTADPTSALTLSGDNSASLGALIVADGQVDLTGTYGGAVSVSGAGSDLDVGATIAGDLDVSDGTTSVNAGGAVEGATTVVGNGTLIANGGTFAGPTPTDNGLITVDDGTVIVAADTSADISNDGGEATVNAGQTLTGIVTNTNGTLTNLGTITGLVTNTDNVIAGGAFDGGIANNAGSVQVTANSSGNVTNAGGNLIIDLGQGLEKTNQQADKYRDSNYWHWQQQHQHQAVLRKR